MTWTYSRPCMNSPASYCVPCARAATPRPDRHVRDRRHAAGHIRVLLEVPVRHIQLPLCHYREPVDRILDRDGRVVIEMTEPATDVGHTAPLPERPVEHLGALVRIGRQNAPNFSA